MSITAKTWEITLYPDNERHQEIYQDLLLNSSVGCSYVGILHDADKTDDGELKKAHVHVIVAYPNTTTLGQLQTRFPNLESNLIEKKDNRKEAIKYLLHITTNARAQNKHIYPKENLFGDANLISLALGEDSHNSLSLIYEWIESVENIDCTFTKLTMFCLSQGIENTLRKYSFIIKEIIKEKKRGY